MGESSLGCFDRSINVLLVSFLDLRYYFTSRRVERWERLPRCRLPPFVIDENLCVFNVNMRLCMNMQICKYANMQICKYANIEYWISYHYENRKWEVKVIISYHSAYIYNHEISQSIICHNIASKLLKCLCPWQMENGNGRLVLVDFTGLVLYVLYKVYIYVYNICVKQKDCLHRCR